MCQYHDKTIQHDRPPATADLLEVIELMPLIGREVAHYELIYSEYVPREQMHGQWYVLLNSLTENSGFTIDKGLRPTIFSVLLMNTQDMH